MPFLKKESICNTHPTYVWAGRGAAFARSSVASATFSQEAIISGSAPTLVQLPHPIKIFVVIPSWPLSVEKLCLH